MKVAYPFHLSALKIKLERGPCLGTCPVYSVELTGTGQLVYRGTHFVAVTGTKRAQVDPLAVYDLFLWAEEIGFFEMAPAYLHRHIYDLDENLMVSRGAVEITDLPSCTVTITTGRQKKKVYNYDGAPKRLIQLENKIDKLADIRKWVKGDK